MSNFIQDILFQATSCVTSEPPQAREFPEEPQAGEVAPEVLENLPTATTTPTRSAALKPPKKKRVFKFVKSWLNQEEFSKWLLYDEGTDRMKCKFCMKHGKSGVWVTCGTDNFR